MFISNTTDMTIVKIKDKRRGVTYVYEQDKGVYDPVKKQTRSHRVLIGKIDPQTGEIVPTKGWGRSRKKGTETGPVDWRAEADALRSRLEELERGMAEVRAELAELRRCPREQDEVVTKKAGRTTCLKKNGAMNNTKNARKRKDKAFHDRKSKKGQLKKKLLSKKKAVPASGNEIISLMLTAFSALKDDRRPTGNFKFKLRDIVVAIAIALFRGCVTFEAAYCFIAANGDFLRSLGLFTNKEARGDLPGKTTIHRIVKDKIDPDDFRHHFFVFMRLASSLVERKGLRIIAGDGKAMRGTQCGKDGKSIVMLSAFDTAARLPLMTVNCEEKSNEIKAWQTLLDKMSDVVGAIFTADAMACQYKIVDRIVKGKNHFCIAVKSNQKGLEDDLETLIEHTVPYDTFTEEAELGHGRIGYRCCEVFHAKDASGCSFITDIDKWRDLKTIVLVKSFVEDVKSGNKRNVEQRIFISDQELTAEEFNHIVRSHWLCEVFHWLLDTNFKQDQIKRRNDTDNTASRNLDLIQKLAYAIGIIFLETMKKEFPDDGMGYSTLIKESAF